MRTDCLWLLRTVEGVDEAIASDKQLARIWGMIAASLDREIESFCASRKLVWLPAYQSASSAGEVELSFGDPMTVIDWRANILADA